MVYKHICLFHVIMEEAVQTEMIHSQADKLNLDTYLHMVYHACSLMPISFS